MFFKSRKMLQGFGEVMGLFIIRFGSVPIIIRVWGYKGLRSRGEGSGV